MELVPTTAIPLLRQANPVGSQVCTEGVVTAVDARGFLLQAADADPGIPGRAVYVFLGGRPRSWIRPGTQMVVQGEYDRYSDPRYQPSQTTIPIIRVAGKESMQRLAKDQPLPPAIDLTAEGALDDGFFEDHFGELVSAELTVVQASNRYGDLYGVIGELEPGTPGTTYRGGLTPEANVLPVGVKLPSGHPRMSVQAQLRVEGPVVCRFGYQVRAQQVVEVRPSPLEPEVTRLSGGEHRLLVATYNLENLDPKVERRELVSDRRNISDDVGDGRFEKLAEQVTVHLNRPDILVVQEMQDDDGAEITDVVSADQTAQLVIDAIYARSGVEYCYADIPPAPNSSGGMPGGNIRCGFFYRADRVSLAKGALRALGEDDPTFEATRKPLVGRFQFAHGDRVDEVVIFNLHKPSMRRKALPDGSGFDDGHAQRMRVGEVVKAEAVATAFGEPELVVLQLGDFNAYAGDPSVEVHGGDGFVCLTDQSERSAYSTYFAGRAGRLDHGYGYVPEDVRWETDCVSINADFAYGVGSPRNSDHDPQLYTLDFSARVQADALG